MYVIIKHSEHYYFHCGGKIILFERPDEGQLYFEKFQQYAQQRLLMEQGPIGMMQSQMVLSQCELIERDFEEDPPCGTILFRELTN